MRRMLDPKEAGGVKLYNHFITVVPKDGGEIYFNYISTDKTEFTKETMLSAIQDKFLICGGYINVQGSAKTIEFVKVFRKKVFSVKWVDLTTLADSTKEIDISYIDDTVFPVD